MLRRLPSAVLVPIAAAIALAVPAGTALGAAPAVTHNPRGRILGIVPARGTAVTPRFSASPASGGPLTYHDGAVVRSNTVHVLLWAPPGYSFPSGYTDLVDQYFTDVAADDGTNTNVYSVAGQYGDSGGRIAYDSTYAGALSDSDALPASGCTDPAFPSEACVTNDQLRVELEAVVASNKLPISGEDIYFAFLPPGVNVCVDGSNSNCSTHDLCGYHTWDGTLLYAIEPFATFDFDDDIGCDDNAANNDNSPNANSADAALSIASHEHNETITDPYGSGWFDSDLGGEIGDLCNFTFGSLLGGSPGAGYNQSIDGHQYYLQEEYSNNDRGCIQRAADTAGPPGNDSFAGAYALTGRSANRNADTNIGATKQAGEPNHAGNRGGASVWYRWKAPRTGVVTIGTLGSSIDTLLGVYRGGAVNGLTKVAANDDISSKQPQSRVSFTAHAGTTYRIAVDGYNLDDGAGADRGRVALHLSEGDTQPPIAHAIHSYGKRGQTAHLRYTVRDNSGKTRDTVRVWRGAELLATIRSSLGSANPDEVYYLGWHVPRSAPSALKFCVRSTDPSGNTSAASCAPLSIGG